ALMGKLERTVRADSGLLEKPPAIDVQRSPMQKLVGVADADRAQTADVVIGDSVEVLERAIHPMQDSVTRWGPAADSRSRQPEPRRRRARAGVDAGFSAEGARPSGREYAGTSARDTIRARV